MDAVVLTWRPINILSIALMGLVIVGLIGVSMAIVKKVKGGSNDAS